VNGIFGHFTQFPLAFTYLALSLAASSVISRSFLANTQTGASDMNNLKSVVTAIAMAGATLSSVTIAQDALASLSLTFTGIDEKEGALMGAVFNSEDAYNGKGAPVRQIMIAADNAQIATQFDGLAPGTYAIKLFHDIDGDMKMTTNPYGMPIEPFAFSNNAQGNMGPAKWADAKFEVKAGANTHSIIIK
jgi:uncharacterized protein (DUF2141 family)